MKKMMMMVVGLMMIATMAHAQWGVALKQGVDSFYEGMERSDRLRSNKLEQERLKLELEIMKRERAHQEEMMRLQREMVERQLKNMNNRDKSEECIDYCKSQYKPGYVGEYFVECVEKCLIK